MRKLVRRLLWLTKRPRASLWVASLLKRHNWLGTTQHMNGGHGLGKSSRRNFYAYPPGNGIDGHGRGIGWRGSTPALERIGDGHAWHGILKWFCWEYCLLCWFQTAHRYRRWLAKHGQRTVDTGNIAPNTRWEIIEVGPIIIPVKFLLWFQDPSFDQGRRPWASFTLFITAV